MIKRKATSLDSFPRRFNTKTGQVLDTAKEKYNKWFQRAGYLGLTIFLLFAFLIVLWIFKTLSGYNRVYTKGDNVINIAYFLVFFIFIRLVRKGRDYEPQGIGGT